MTPTDTTSDAPRLVLAIGDPLARETARTGGKGASLARLAQGGFPVPEALLVGADAYRAFARGADLRAAGALSVTEPEALRRECESLRATLVATAFPPEVDRELRAALADLVGRAGSVSVRSSATLEDLAGGAFAGQHDTFLGVRGLDAVMDAIRRCYASLWEDRAVRYRHELGFAPDAADMAVVVQTMVQADAAGVAFSMSPITGQTDRVLVTSAFGLGETVVSGDGEVDQFIVAKADGRVIERHVGLKAEEVVQAGAGTVTRPVEPARAASPSLDEGSLRQVVDLALKAERHFEFPQDVEWAIAGGRLHILQSRPITRFPERWTRQDSAERFPSPMTPLTWDFSSGGFHDSLRHSLGLMGLPDFEGRWFERLDGYIYGNQTAIEVFTAGHQVAFASLEELEGRVEGFAERFRWVQELPMRWARDLDRYLLALGRLSAVPLEDLDTPALWDHVLRIDEAGRRYFLPNIAISIAQGLMHRMLYRLVTMVVGPDAAAETYDGLTCFCETKTNLVNRDLHELYELARADAALAAALQGEDRRALWESGALGQHAAFHARFARFLEDHGHREVDFDAYQPTWSGQPWVVLENLRLMLLSGRLPDPGRQDQASRARQHATERAFLPRLPAPLRTLGAELVRLCRVYTALDDLEHYQTTRLHIPFRAALMELGGRLVQAKVADQPDEVFFLSRATLGGFVRGDVPAAAAAAELRANRASYQDQLRVDPPFQHGVAPEDEAPQGDALRGLAGAPGMAEGAVAIVRSSDDFAAFPPGSVLVARTTNPAWTPLFYAAVAVVTESGGPLSHGAVTARELGIPAVVAVRGAMHTFMPGDRIRVNGTAGTVTRVSDDAPAAPHASPPA
ncbi:MAG TPA: PEP/pyruvate-binding domain-containing protein [Anaerolineae bacterium]|nr:PEP/pyruvate-binding domain-containing protein [Anaerolineae bacterium]